MVNIMYCKYWGGGGGGRLQWGIDIIYTVEPRYNEDLGTMKITLLYQVSCYIKVQKNIYI